MKSWKNIVSAGNSQVNVNWGGKKRRNRRRTLPWHPGLRKKVALQKKDKSYSPSGKSRETNAKQTPHVKKNTFRASA